MSVDSKNYLVLPLMFYKLGFFILCGYMCSPAVRSYSIHVQFLPTHSLGLPASPVCVVRAMLIWDTPQRYRFWRQLPHTESLWQSGNRSPRYACLGHFPPWAGEPRPGPSWADGGIFTPLHTPKSIFPGSHLPRSPLTGPFPDNLYLALKTRVCLI